MCNIKKEDYVNKAHMFYCEFLKLAKSTFPNSNLFQHTIEDIVDKGLMTHNRKLFEKIEEVCRFLDFSYTNDFVLIKYKPYYILYPEWKEYCERNGLEGFGEKDLWNHWDGLLRYCRGIVFHRHSGELVINPYDKFFNIDELEECSTENIIEKVKDGTFVEISEKYDGSLIMARFFNGKFVMCSSGQLDELKCPQLRESCNILVNSGLLRSMIRHYPSLTFIFELISPNDTHVVKYEGDAKLVLIGIKSTNSNYAFPYKNVISIAENWYIHHTNIFNTTLEEVLSNRDKKKAHEAEGFVLNVDGYRVKIKYEDYMNVAGFVSTLNPKIIIRAVADGCLEELKISCPGCAEYIDSIVDIIFKYIKLMTKKIDECYTFACKVSADKGEFMRAVQANAHQSIMGFVIDKYYGRFSILKLLKSGSGRYIKFQEIKEHINKEELADMPF